jgi:hypothetical protein
LPYYECPQVPRLDLTKWTGRVLPQFAALQVALGGLSDAMHVEAAVVSACRQKRLANFAK